MQGRWHRPPQHRHGKPLLAIISGQSHYVHLATMRSPTAPSDGQCIGPDRCIADTGCGDDLIGTTDMTPHCWQDVEASDAYIWQTVMHFLASTFRCNA